jgi:Cof subfamily protein (haloacid dehalogenase superfamily)
MSQLPSAARSGAPADPNSLANDALQTIQPNRQADIKLLVLDIDGTIAGQSNTIREPVLQAVRAVQAKGIAVTIATGRMYQSALRFYRCLNTTLPLIAYQGAWIQAPSDAKPLWHAALPERYVRELLDYFEQPQLAPEVALHFYLNDELYVSEMSAETALYAARSGRPVIVAGDLRSLLPQEPTKLLAMSDNTDLIQTALADLKQIYPATDLYLTTSTATFLEATHPTANKGAAVRYLAEQRLGLSAHNVMAVGDNFNDFEMIQYAGIGVAMGDAPLGVQQVAQWVAPGVEDDGVVAAIEKFLL